jgi:hypothetical protein
VPIVSARYGPADRDPVQTDPSAKPASILRAALVAAALLTCALLLGPAAASASCGRTTLDTSKQQLVSGEAVRLGGTACGSSVRIMIGHEEHWELLSALHAGAGGRFATRVHVGVPRSVSSVDLRAASSHGLSRRIRVHIEHPAPAPAPVVTPAPAAKPAFTPAPGPTPTPAAEATSTPTPAPEPEPTPSPSPEPEPTPTPAPEPTPTPAPEPTPTPEACPLGATTTSAPIEMSMPGCKAIASDTTSESNPLPFWGSIQCQSSSRYATEASDGDTHTTATGAPQGNTAYRKLTAFDGDDFYGERCELGENDSRTGTTVFYHEGQHRVTYLSERLPSNYPLANPNWQTVMQMKQTQPSNDATGGPELEMQAREGKWVVIDSWKTLWEFPAQANKWTRFAYDVYYSQDPSKGWIQVSADLNGDGDFNDPGERSPVIHTATLRTEPAPEPGTADVGLPAGAPIPSHLRVGIYHNPVIPCVAPSGCSVDVDNVQVMAP